MMDHKQIASVVKVISGIMLILAVGEWGYSYYQILRVVVCISSVYLAWHMFNIKQQGWGYGFLATAILFNPILPIYLDKNIWQVLDVAIAIYFLASLKVEQK